MTNEEIEQAVDTITKVEGGWPPYDHARALLLAILNGENNEDKKAVILAARDAFKSKLERCDRPISYDEFVDRFWQYEPVQHGGMPEFGYAALALTGEAGEVAEKVKKIYRDCGGKLSPEASSAMVRELGDCLFYLVKLAHCCNRTLEGVKSANVEKLNSRALRGTLRGDGDDR